MKGWVLEYSGFDPEQVGLREALCTLGNGFIGTRGAAPEARADGTHYPGTYRIGCYNRLSTTIHGTTVENESLVNLPNWLDLRFRLDGGEWFDPSAVELLDHQLRLDIRRGVLTRQTRFRTDGRTTRLTQRRIVSMADPHLAVLESTWQAEDWSGRLEILSGLDGRVENSGVERYQQLEGRHLEQLYAEEVDEESVVLQVRTTQSKIRIAQAARVRLTHGEEPYEVPRTVEREPGYVGHSFEVDMEEGRAVTLEKVVSIYTSLDRAISETGEEARRDIRLAPSFPDLLERHVLAWDRLWGRCRIGIGADGSPESGRHTVDDAASGGPRNRAHLTVNLYLFHLLQTVSENTTEHDVGIPARGIHGEAYRGHVFWDELFVFPVLNLRLPELTRSVLEYRYRRLREARRGAREAGFEGAMFPWQSGSNGREETQTLHLNPRSGRWIPDHTRLQRHINVAIPYSIWQYYEATDDIEFMAAYGAEIFLEIARFWGSRVEYDRVTGRYGIHGVIGPDEYHDAYPDAEEPGIDNNAYTNVMVVWVLLHALRILDILPGRRREEVREKLGLQQSELTRWEDISRKMTVPFHDGVISQFEGYEKLEEFDWEGYREKYDDIQRLDRILEAEGDTPNRYKVSKQADVLMLFYLLSADELGELFDRLDIEFDLDSIPDVIDYYVQRTSHGSTLSGVVHAWVLARQNRERSWHFFQRALESDISDIQGGTTPEGIHLGAMAGSVDLLQRCYSGLEIREGMLRLNPYLPPDLPELCFNLQYRNNWLDVEITSESLSITSEPSSAASIGVAVRDREMEITPGSQVEIDLREN